MISSLVDRLLPLVAWAALVYVAFVTLSPIEARPVVVARPGFEHLAAFGVIAVLFCLAYPRHTLLVVALLLGFVVLLEALQLLVPGRHGRIADAMQKWIGVAGGAAAAYLVNRWRGL